MLLLVAGGCATTKVPPASLDPVATIAQFDARRLDDPGLRKFLADNLGRAPGQTWDFETLSWVAFYYHPSLALARAQWATSQAVARTAGMRPNPTLTLTPGYNSTREPGVSPWMPGINLDFLFVSARKAGLQHDIGRHDVEAARLGIALAAWSVRSELRRALIDLSAAARREVALRTQAGVQRQVLGLLEQRLAAGAIAATEISATRSTLLRAEAALAEAANQAAVARVRVAAALGIPSAALQGEILPSPTAAPTFTADSLSAARRESLHTRAEVLAALAKYQAAHSALELEIAKQQPDFHLGPGYQWDQGPNKWSLAISFEIPVFHRNEPAIAEALARRAEAAAQFDLVQTQAIAAIDAASAAQQAAAAQRERLEQLRAEVERQQRLVQQRQQLGAADQVEVQTARLDLATVELALVDAETASAMASGALEDALQVPFPHFAELK